MQQITCGSCGKAFTLKPDMAGKKVRCTCGNVMTVPLSTARTMPDDPDQYRLVPDPTASPRRPAPPAPPPPPKPAGPPVRRRFAGIGAKEVEGNEASGALKLGIILLVVISILVGGIITYKNHSRSQAAAQSAMKGDDSIVFEKLENEYNKEVREWFKEDDHRMLGGWTRRQAEAHIDEWYNAGAVKVICFSRMMSLTAAIELPTVPAQRTKFYQWYLTYCANHRFKPTADVGQKYLLMDIPR